MDLHYMIEGSSIK